MAIVVFAGRWALAAGYTEFSRAVRGRVYAARWWGPKKVPPKLKFCVLAQDEAGNDSRVSCAKILIS